MSFTVEQTVGKHVYVYEVTSYWDKEKKQPRQKRTFIGKKDPITGEIIRKKQKQCLSFEYGPIYFLTETVESLGLQQLLFDAFGDAGTDILLAACFRVAEQKPLYLCDRWFDRTYLTTPCDLSSQRLSELVREIGEDEQAVSAFLHQWASRQRNNQFIVFDITSISSYSQHIDYVEWGHNRDKEPLAQINLGIVYAEPPDTPLFYSVYPGSIPDVKTLKNILKKLSVFEVTETLFVMDKGFYSKSNLVEIGDSMKIVIPLPANNKVFSELINRYVETMVTSDNAFHSGKQLLYKVQDSIQIGEYDYVAHLFLDTKRKQQEETALHAFILDIELRVGEKEYTSYSALQTFLDDGFSGWKYYFKIEQQNGLYTVAKKNQSIQEAVKKFGTLVLLTNSNIDGEKALSFYRKKDGVEKLFDSMKNGLDLKRLRVHSRKSMHGILFIDFIALILYSWIHRTLKSDPLGKKYTMNELFYELKKLSVVTIGTNQKILTEVSKRQRMIFDAFGMTQPSIT